MPHFDGPETPPPQPGVGPQEGAQRALPAAPPDIAHALAIIERVRQGERPSSDDLRMIECTLRDQGEALRAALAMARRALPRSRQCDSGI